MGNDKHLGAGNPVREDAHEPRCQAIFEALDATFDNPRVTKDKRRMVSEAYDKLDPVTKTLGERASLIIEAVERIASAEEQMGVQYPLETSADQQAMLDRIVSKGLEIAKERSSSRTPAGR